MFTGIVQQAGIVQAIDRKRESAGLRLALDSLAEKIHLGDSVMIDGVCLTATKKSDEVVDFDVGTETLKKTTLGSLRKNQSVNVELAMQPTDRFGGHFVSGHIDGTGTIISITKSPGETRLKVRVTDDLQEQMIPKGSVALDGISLTIAKLGPDFFEVSLIPHTLSVTTLEKKKSGDRVNIECDMIGKWVRRFMNSAGYSEPTDKTGLTLSELEEKGF